MFCEKCGTPVEKEPAAPDGKEKAQKELTRKVKAMVAILAALFLVYLLTNGFKF